MYMYDGLPLNAFKIAGPKWGNALAKLTKPGIALTRYSDGTHTCETWPSRFIGNAILNNLGSICFSAVTKLENKKLDFLFFCGGSKNKLSLLVFERILFTEITCYQDAKHLLV